MAESPFLAVGTVVSERYEILGELGRGGSSVVFSARDRTSGAEVALKLVVPPPALAALAEKRISREAEALAMLSHPCITKVLGTARHGPWPCLIMELARGSDVGVLVRRNGPLGTDQVRRIGIEVASALGEAHKRGILHRDVKPQNILVEADGRVRLTDFGSAWIEGQLTLTQTGTFVGTPDYAAPEVKEGKRADARSDIFSLGRTLAYALGGGTSSGQGGRDWVNPAFSQDVARAEHERAGGALQSAISRACSKDPRDRFPTAASFAFALQTANPAALPTLPASRERRACVLCGMPDPFGWSICPGCLTPADTEDTVFLLVRAGAHPGPERLTAKVAQMLEADLHSDKVRAVASGWKPLVRLSRRSAERIACTAPDLNLIPASAADRWKFIPFRIWLPAVLAGLSGLVAALAVDLRLLWGTVAIEALTLLAGPLWLIRPALGSGRGASGPFENLSPSVRETIAILETSPVKDLLVDIVATAGSLLRLGNSPRVAELIVPLVEAASSAALRIIDMEKSLARLERNLALSPAAPALDAAFLRCATVRDSLFHELLEGLAAVSESQSRLAPEPQEAVASLAERTTALRAGIEKEQRIAEEISTLEAGPAPLPRSIPLAKDPTGRMPPSLI